MAIAERLKIAREKTDLSQKEVGEKTKINPKNISHWEHGRTIPSLHDLRILANLYHVTTDWLIGDVNAYSDELSKQKYSGFIKAILSDDPELQEIVKDIQFDGSIGKLGGNHRLSDQDIAFIKNAIRLAYKAAVSSGQPVVEIKPKED